MFDWKQYIQLAEKIRDVNKIQEFQGLEEACLRTSMSRAYYGIFCIARNFLISKKQSKIPTIDTHKFVRNEYINSRINEEKIVGENLKQLWRKRKKADYEDSITIENNEIDFCIKTANNTLKLIDQLSKD